MNIQPFKIAVQADDISDLHSRLERTRFTEEIPGSGSEYGVNLEWVKRLTEYWRSGYDWRVWEARLNAYPQFTTEIDGQKIHFLHIRSGRRKALPLIANCNNLCNRKTASTLITVLKERTANTYDTSSTPERQRSRNESRNHTTQASHRALDERQE